MFEVTYVARWSGLAAILGGVLWIVFSTGLTFTHGPTQIPRNATLLGLSALAFNRILALPPLLFIVGLAGLRLRGPTARGRSPGEAGFVVALIGLIMVSLGVVFETWIIDPNKDFFHPIVQAGWILYIFGLFPVHAVGMILFGLASSHLEKRFRALGVGIGVLSSLPMVAALAASGSTTSLVVAMLNGLLGLGWILLGYALWDGARERPTTIAASRKSNLIHWSGLASILAGLTWSIGFAGMTKVLLPVISQEDGHWLLGLAGLLTLLTIMGLGTQVARRTKRLGMVGYILAISGASLFAIGNIVEVGLGLEFGTRLFGLGLVSLIAGTVLLGFVLLRAKALPWWAVWPLIIGILAIVPSLTIAARILDHDGSSTATVVGAVLILASTGLLGAGWMLLGYTLWSDTWGNAT